MQTDGEIQLLDDRVLLQRVDRGETETQGGIMIPDNAVELGDCALVVAVGPGKRREDDLSKRDPCDVKPGQTVVIQRYAGAELKVNGVEHLIVRDADILAIDEGVPVVA
jgi:chaperonin GroES